MTTKPKTGKVDPVCLAALEIHNEFRQKHGAPPLELDDKLCKEAKKYAKAVVRGTQLPEEIPGVGRNEYQSSGEEGEPREDVARDAVTEWYDYVEEYNWECPTQSGQNALLFSQVIWKNSKTLGFGIACHGEEIVVIGLYSPAGNSTCDTPFKENVQKALS